MKTEKEINDLVAIEVMGFTRSAHENLNFELMGWKTGENSWTSSFSPSKDRADAWQVVDTIGEDRFSVRQKFISYLQEIISDEIGIPFGRIIGASELLFKIKPKHICLAALKAKGIDLDKT